LSKKLRFFAEYAIHYFKKYVLAIVLGSIFGSIFFLQKDNLNQIYQALQTNNVDVGIQGLYTIQTLPFDITNLLSFGFTTISENDKANVSPIIKELNVRNSNRSYLFTFKEGLFWHNGKKFSTDDINLTIPKVEMKPTLPDKIDVTVTEEFSPLLSKLSQPLFLNKTLVGLGAYKADKITYRDGYIKTLAISTTDNSHQKITYRFYPNTEDLLNAFKLGEVDEISVATLDDQMNNWPNTKVSKKISTNRYLAIFFNTDKLSNKQIRQSLAYATPKSEDKNDRCLGPISPNSWAYNPQIKEYNFNATRAKELFQNNKIDQINLTVTDRNLLKTAENIKTNWQQTLKIKVNIKVVNQQFDVNEDFDAILAYLPIPSDPDQYPFWHSTQLKTNLTNLNNSRIDKLLEEGRQTQDLTERKRIYYDFQRFLLEESPVIFLNFPTTYTISRVK
jgi:ABC-type transport system substrate-binding protein